MHKRILRGEMPPSEIFRKVAAAYDSLQTYRAEGTIVSNIDMGGSKVDTNTSFSILLKKPNLYRISWSGGTPVPGMAQGGAVWSDGTQPYLYMRIANEYSKEQCDELALAGATGISGGTANTIPSLFLSVYKERPAPFSRLKDPMIEKTEAIEGEDCYVISGASTVSKKEIYWISKSRFLIVKYARSLEPPEGGRPMPKMTDKDLDESIRNMGQEVTEESRKRMREMINRAMDIVNTSKMKGWSTETHVNISSPKLKKADFRFAPPKTAVMKDSSFDSLFSGGK